MAKPRKDDLDWEEIQRLYRTGQLTVAEISRRHGCAKSTIVRMAKREGWERDLSKNVRTATRSQLIESRVRKEVKAAQQGKGEELVGEERDAIAIKVAAASNVQILEKHIRTIGQGRGLVDKLMVELQMSTDNRDLIKELIDSETEEDRNDRRKEIILKACGIKQRAATLRDLASAASTLIAVERQALNLDDSRTEEDDFAQFYAAVKAKPGQRLSTMIAARIGSDDDET